MKKVFLGPSWPLAYARGSVRLWWTGSIQTGNPSKTRVPELAIRFRTCRDRTSAEKAKRPQERVGCTAYGLTNMFWRFSLPMVVLAPWPATTMVSSGRV